MKTPLALLAACALLAATDAALAQAPATTPSPAPAPQQPPAEPGPSLNLKLEDPALSARPPIRFGPAEQESSSLPSLGADARRVEELPRSQSRTSSYPPDTNPGR
jgi:hypothetical protein